MNNSHPNAEAPPTRAPDRPKARTRSGVWKPVFLATLASTGSVSAAIRATGVSRWAAYEAFAYDAAFHERWVRALLAFPGTCRARNYGRRPRPDAGRSKSAQRRRQQRKPPRLDKSTTWQRIADDEGRHPRTPIPDLGTVSDATLAGRAARVLRYQQGLAPPRPFKPDTMRAQGAAAAPTNSGHGVH